MWSPHSRLSCDCLTKLAETGHSIEGLTIVKISVAHCNAILHLHADNFLILSHDDDKKVF
jgi:hypothetical protein